MYQSNEFIPGITWSQLKIVLLSLSDTPSKRRMVEHLVEATRKQSPFLTPEGITREILYIGAALLDVRFQPLDWDLSTLDAS